MKTLIILLFFLIIPNIKAQNNDSLSKYTDEELNHPNIYFNNIVILMNLNKITKKSKFIRLYFNNDSILFDYDIRQESKLWNLVFEKWSINYRCYLNGENIVFFPELQNLHNLLESNQRLEGFPVRAKYSMDRKTKGLMINEAYIKKGKQFVNVKCFEEILDIEKDEYKAIRKQIRKARREGKQVMRKLQRKGYNCEVF